MVINVQLFYIGRLTSSCFQNKNWKFEIYGKGWYWERLKEIVVIKMELDDWSTFRVKKVWMYRKNDIKEVKWEIPKKDEKPRIYKENRENEQRKLSFYVDGKKVY